MSVHIGILFNSLKYVYNVYLVIPLRILQMRMSNGFEKLQLIGIMSGKFLLNYWEFAVSDFLLVLVFAQCKCDSSRVKLWIIIIITIRICHYFLLYGTSFPMVL